VWIAVGKFIRSQVNKDKIVDTMFFGTFAKASTVSESKDRKEDHYLYCPGPKAVFKLVENKDNVADIKENILNERLVSLNVSSVA